MTQRSLSWFLVVLVMAGLWLGSGTGWADDDWTKTVQALPWEGYAAINACAGEEEIVLSGEARFVTQTKPKHDGTLVIKQKFAHSIGLSGGLLGLKR